eukprot:IDg7923t1
MAVGGSDCSGRSQGPLVALRCSYRPMLAFLPRAGRAPATAHATSNTVAFGLLGRPTWPTQPRAGRATATAHATSVSIARACGYYCLCTSSTYVFPA